MTRTARRLLPFVSAAFAACLAAASPATANAPPRTPSIYRFDVSISGVDAAQHAPATYTLVLEEDHAGSLSTGANVPLATTAGAPRQDVGLSLRLEYTLVGSVVVVTGGLELSSVEATSAGGASTIHRVRADGTAPVRPGAPSLLASVYDAASGRRYEVTVSAQRLL